MLSVKCPSCGGTVIFDETKNVPTYCSFCSAHLPDMTVFVQESLKLGIDQKRLDMDQQRTNMYIRRQNTANKADHNVVIVSVVAIVLAIIFFGFLFKLMNLFG